jgi:hypothetical protein
MWQSPGLAWIMGRSMNRKKSGAKAPAPAPLEWSSLWCLVVLALVLLFAAAVRVRLLEIPLERDEGEYAYAGQMLLEGTVPYAQVYNMKLPGTYAAYAIIEGIFGMTVAGIHCGFLLVNAGASVLVFLIGRRLFGGMAGAMGGAGYALLSLSPSVLGTSAHATHFVVLPVLAGFLLLLRYLESPKPVLGFFSAVLFGLGFVMKQQGVFFPAFAMFGLGLVTPFAFTCAVLWWQGVWSRFWFWTFEYARAYVSTVSTGQGWTNFWSAFTRVVEPCLFLWILAGAGLLAVLVNRKWADMRATMMSFALFSLLTITPGLYFRSHYFVTALPAVALLAGAGCAAVGGLMLRWKPGWARGAAPTMLAVVALGWPVVQQRAFFFEMTPIQASRHLYGLEPFPEAVEIGRRLQEQSKPEDRIAILGAEPEIFFYAHRRSATGYIYVYSVWEDQRYADRMAQEMIREIETAQPRFIIVQYIPPRLDGWARPYLRQFYEPEGRADILSDEQTRYYWGADARKPGPAPRNVVHIFRRRAPLSVSGQGSLPSR